MKYMREKSSTEDESKRTNIQLELVFLRERLQKMEEEKLWNEYYKNISQS